MIDTDGGSLPADYQPNSVGLVCCGHLTLSQHSSNESGELLQCFCHNDSCINIGITIIVIIIIIIIIIVIISISIITLPHL